MRNLFARAARGQLIIEVLIRLRGFAILPFVSRALGVKEFGWFALASAVIGLLSSLGTFGLSSGLYRFLPGKDAREEQAALFWPALVASLVTLSITATLAGVAIWSFPIIPKELPDGFLYVIPVGIVALETKNLALNFFRVSLRLDQYYRLAITDVVVGTAIQIGVLAFWSGGAVKLLGASVLGDVLAITLALTVVTRTLPWRRPTLRAIWPLAAFGLPLSANGVLNWANNSMDRFFVQRYVGSGALGVYSLGYAVGLFAVVATIAPIFAILPTILFRLWDHGERERASALVERVAVLMVATAMPVVLSLQLFGQPAIELLAGHDFAPSHAYVGWVALGYLLMYLGDLYGYPLIMRGKPGVYSVALAVGVGVNFLANALLVPTHGAIGSAWASAISFACVSAVLYTANRLYDCPPLPVRRPLAIAVVALACWGATALAWPDHATWEHSIAFSVVTMAVYGTVLVTTRLLPMSLLRAVVSQREDELADASSV